MRSDRLLSILLLLQARGRLTARELAERLEVSPRTVQRDLDALSAAGVPVYAERGRHGGSALLPGYRTDVSGLTAGEARALFIFAGRGALADLGLEREFQAAVRKLLAALPEPQRPGALRAQERVVVDPRGWMRQPDDTTHLATVQEAVWSDRRLRFSYRSPGAGRSTEHVVDPWGVVAKAGVWYLIAGRQGEPRLYRVSRIEKAVVLEESSERPTGLDLDEVWEQLRRRVEQRGTGVTVRLRARSERVEMVLRVCASQLLEPPEREPDADSSGWTVLRLRFPAEGAARGALLGFGADLEVLAPNSLRRAFAETAREVIALYAAG